MERASGWLQPPVCDSVANGVAAKRICIFCGEPPQDKNREHPLPQWLLRMTGDPNRVVRHGYHWGTNRVFEFAFDQFHFPACQSCNDRYSGFEAQAKEVVASICRKEPASPKDYVLLLDWLDKVRIGMWLAHWYLQRNPNPPNFAIEKRLGAKDRMLALHTIGDHQKGLNVWGAESPLFQIKPSVFAIRINNILLLNASWDYMCASRTGYPYPRRVRFSREHAGALACSEFRRRGRIISPVMPGLMKSCVTLFQPIIQPNFDGSITALSGEDMNYHLANAWPGRNNVGPLVRQFRGHAEMVDPEGPAIEFDEVSLAESNTALDIAMEAYRLQIVSSESDSDRYDDETPVPGMKEGRRRTAAWNRATMKAYYRERDRRAKLGLDQGAGALSGSDSKSGPQ